MNVSISNINVQKKKIDPKLFLLYIAFASMIMFFSSLSSALIVKKGDTLHWVEVTLPNAFLISTFIILLSSVTIQYAKMNLGKSSSFFISGLATFLLAIAFVYFQWLGWSTLNSNSIFLNGNPSGSFIYVISFFHLLHYLGGIIFLALLVFRYRKVEIGDIERLNFKILTQYWHFIGLIWVYLYLFFKFIIYK